MSRRLWAGLAAVLLALWGGHVAGAIGQTDASKEVRLKEPIKYGSSCRRLADSREGIFKRDACNRTYCGLADVKDIIEVRPDFAAEHGCTWQLAGVECKCLKASKP